jgi:predicted acylesterase/phospholipase RssA
LPTRYSVFQPSEKNRLPDETAFINEFKEVSVRTRNKLGLALSGGGFRASFFHIGVLARLAELDLLRSVEVISTVSGGSIIGALYYLRVKKLLESARDNKITPSDYVAMVRSIEEDFFEGVQKNLRTRAYADFGKNLKMIKSREFSRSDRMAELYDEYFYDRVSAHPRICLDELKIHPPGEPADFNPRHDNRDRGAKVPALIINATTLNSGRNWQFSVVDAGEHEPDTILEREQVDEYDKSILFKAFRYDAKELPEKYRHIPLSVAVAASACVPGIFPPLPLTDLYPNATPKLVDGGVFDNQGTSALLYEECTDLLMSDASGQMNDMAKPPSNLLSVLLRTNSVTMDRIRDSGFALLRGLKEAGEIHTYQSLHLKEDFDVDKVSPMEHAKDAVELAHTGHMTYGINGEVQLELSGMRTDLDSFTEVEGKSVMYSGYAIARAKIPLQWQATFKTQKAAAEKLRMHRRQLWGFEEIRSFTEAPYVDAGFARQLSVAQQTMFKAFRLMPGLMPVGVLIGLVALVGPAVLLGGLWYLISHFSLWDVVLSILIITFGVALFAIAVSRKWLKIFWEEFVLQYVLSVSVALFGSLAAKLHLRWIDPRFLANGTIRHLQESRRD